jgi:predicted nucleotide-binding protein
MARIDQELLDRIRKKLGVGQARAYARIQAVANQHILDNSHAALVLASQLGISIQKYSTPEDRAQIRGMMGGGLNTSRGSPSPAAVPEESRPARRARSKPNRPAKAPKNNSVFVVHGRNESLRKSMFDFLRALGLDPMEWSRAVLTVRRKGGNPYVGEILDAAMARVQAVVVMLSPDDEARLKERFCSKEEKKTERKPRGQPRPNVLFEAGMALARHPEKTLLVQIGTIRELSDIGGKHVVRLDDSFVKRNDVANRLEHLGCKVERRGSDWTDVGDFSKAAVD